MRSWQRIRSIHDHLVANERKYAALSSPAEASAAVLHAQNLVGTYDSYMATTELEEMGARRDRHMAEMVQGLLGQFGPIARMALIAHNLHVATVQNRMGGYLRQRLGERYYAMELLFDRGTFWAMNAQTKFQQFTVDGASADSVEFQLTCANLDNAFVDYRRSTRSKTVQAWQEEFHNQRVTGAMYDPTQAQDYTRALSPLKWDGLIYIRSTSPTSPPA